MEEKTLFDTLYEGASEAIKSMRKPLVERNIKRKLAAGFDDAQSKIDTANISIQDEIMKATDANMQTILESKAKIRSLLQIQEDISNMHQELFNKDME